MSRVIFAINFLRFSLSPVFKWGCIAYSLLGFVAFIFTNFIPGYDVWGFLPDWSLSTWIVLFAIIVVVGVLEGAYARYRIDEERRGSKLVDVDKWRSQRNPITGAACVAAFVCLLPIALMWKKSTASHMKISSVQIGWEDDNGIVHISPTSQSPANVLWVANIHYQSSISRRILYLPLSFRVSPLPDNASARNQIEDQIWDSATSQLERTWRNEQTLLVPARTPMFFTITSGKFDQTMLNDIAENKAALYFVAVFANQHGSQIAGVCVFRQGESPAVYVCHEHNWP
jgi:hypothetical protein